MTMEYVLKIYDSNNTWAVVTDCPDGKIGYLYKFKPRHVKQQ